MRRMVLLLGALVANPVFAAGGSLTLGAASDYIWRGVAQTDRDVAYQVTGRYEDAAGFYVQAFSTPVDRVFYPEPSVTADVRGDFTLGMSAKTAGALGWDFGFNIVRFDEARLGFEEVFLALSYGEWRAQGAHDWDHDATYSRVGGEFDVGSDVLIALFVGRFDGKEMDAYTDVSAGISTTSNGWRLGLEFTDTDIDRESDATGFHTVLSVSRKF